MTVLEFRRSTVAALLFLAIAGAAACGSGGSTDDHQPAGSVSAQDGASPATAECGGAEAAVAAALQGSPEVTNASVIECSELAISTSLTVSPEGKSAAMAICEKAGPVAYQNGLNGLFVQSVDKKQLASGGKGMGGCLSKP